jgi:hypothetical protein
MQPPKLHRPRRAKSKAQAKAAPPNMEVKQNTHPFAHLAEGEATHSPTAESPADPPHGRQSVCIARVPCPLHIFSPTCVTIIFQGEVSYTPRSVPGNLANLFILKILARKFLFHAAQPTWNQRDTANSFVWRILLRCPEMQLLTCSF